MRTLVLGTGFMGMPLALALNADVAVCRLNEHNADTLAPFDVVVNTAAKTSIDWCEKNREEAFDTNVVQAVRVAKLLRPDQRYVFISSACIFQSDTPDDINYEDTQPNPQCFYTYTKLMAEQLLAEVRPDTLVIRPRLLISEYSHPRNTINKLLKYTDVIDTPESATILEDLITKVKELIDIRETGPFNIFNEGLVTPSQICTMWNHPHNKITKQELDALVRGKARRVTTILGSKRTAPLPDIMGRLMDIRSRWHISRDE